MQYYLLKYGYINLHAISYPVNSSEFQESLEFVNNKILEILPKEDDEIVVIGQSFGGLICKDDFWPSHKYYPRLDMVLGTALAFKK